MRIDPAEAFSEALEHYRAGRLDAAERACVAALQQDQGFAVAWNLRGIVAYSLGQHEAALSCFTQAIAVAPRQADFHSNQGLALQALGRHESALRSYQQSLDLHPTAAATHDNLGSCLQDLKRYDEAVASHRRALELDPLFATAHNNLGNSYLALGRMAEALAALRRALELAPGYAIAHNNLGTALLRQKALADAAVHFERVIELDPRMADAFNNLGVVRKQQGDLPLAARLFEQAIQRRPGYVEALNNLGTVLLMLDQYEAAIEPFRQAARVEPHSAANHDRLGNALRLANRPEEARASLERAVELDPRLASAHAHLGTLWHDRGQLAQAAECYRRALALEPRSCFAHTSLAQALVALGDSVAAVTHLQQALQAQPDHAVAHWLLACTLPEPLDGARVERLEQLLAAGRSSDYDRSYLHFALAQSFDKAGDYERALQHARSANELTKVRYARRGLAFDRARHIAEIDRRIATYSHDFFAAARGMGNASDLPVFIVGMPRSGTTLVEQILASHSQVHGGGELDDLRRLEPAAREIFGAGLLRAGRWTVGEVARTQGLADAHLQRLAQLGGPAARVVDKMPMNFLDLGVIAALFPQARVIHCVRDPRDVLLSCYLQNFSGDAMSFACDWDDLTLYWQQYERLMEHWRSVLPLRLHEVSYEELVRDQESVSRRLIEWCGLPWEPGCLDFHKTPRIVATASAAQVRVPIYAQSVARWRNYEPHYDGFVQVEPLT